MSDQITTAQVQEYKAGLQILFQQQGALLRDKVRWEEFTGERAFFDQVGSVLAYDYTVRNQPTQLVATPFSRRSITLQPKMAADTVDPRDLSKVLQDPQGAIRTTQAYALGRALDKVIIDAALGSAWTGKSGTVEVVFPTATRQVGVQFGTSPATDVGMTVRKLREAARMLNASQIPQQVPRYIAMTSKQHDDLLGETQVVSMDFQTRPVLENGRIRSFMGFEFVLIEDAEDEAGNVVTMLNLVNTTERRCIAWAKTSLLGAANPSLSVDIGPRRDLSSVEQILSWGAFGSSRMDEKGVVEIICQE